MITDIIKTARGHQKAELILHNAVIVNVFSSEILASDIVIHSGAIVAIGLGYSAHETIDLEGRYVSPGFIDAHIHIESSMVEVPEFTRAVLPLGTTSVIADPHEIANVLGYEGIRYMMESSKYNPLNVFFTLSSCVPSSTLETAGSEMRAFDIYPFLREKWVVGLAEMMNYPALLEGNPDVLDKLRIVDGKRIDGHAPGLSGMDLNAYIAAGVESDHECTTVEEAREKLRLGMYIMIREGTATKNLRDLLPLVTPENERRIMFCTDDRHPHDILAEGHMNYIIKSAIQQGLAPVQAIRMATLNTADYFGLKKLGAIAPGRTADLVVFDDFTSFDIKYVFKNGMLVARDGVALYDPPVRPRVTVRGSVNIRWLEGDEFRIPARGKRARVIGVIPDQIITRTLTCDIEPLDGYVESSPVRDILKIFVVERHHGSGQVGKGLIKGFGLQRGAIASTIAHDSHNIIVVGVRDADIIKAVTAVNKMGGGIAIVEDEHLVAALELPIAGLMSDQPLEVVSARMSSLSQAAHALGVTLKDPIMTLSFMALPVIPALKLTDLGLVDVARFEHVDLFLD